MMLVFLYFCAAVKSATAFPLQYVQHSLREKITQLQELIRLTYKDAWFVIREKEKKSKNEVRFQTASLQLLKVTSASSPTFASYKAGQIIIIIIVIVKIIKIIIMTMISYIGVCCPDSSSPQLPPTPAPTQPPTPAPTQAPNPPPTRGKPSPPCKTSIHQTRRNTIYFLL